MVTGATMQAGGRAYRPDIDGLRAVAVVVVVLHHLSTSWVPGGFIGVDVFFVISGYLITKIIRREMMDGDFTFARFYERRVRRLFPALFTVLAFVLGAGWFLLLPSDYLSTFRAAAGTMLFSANFVFWRDMQAGYFAADAKLNPLLHMWSLGVEEQFYLLFPMILLLLHRHAARWMNAALIAGFLLSLALSIALTPIKPVAAYFLLPTRAWELMAGSLLATVSLPRLCHRISREFLSLLALSAILVPALLYSAATPFPSYAAALPVAGTAALVWLGGMEGGESTIVGRFLRLRFVVYIGLISYSLYLWHWPLIVFARFQNGLQPINHWVPALLALSITLAGLSHRFIESGFRRGLGDTKLPMFVGIGAIMLGLMSITLAGLARRGFEGRVSTEVLALDKERSPEIPFIECDNRDEGCLIGSRPLDGSPRMPSVLFWGDSHMLAWAPVLDAVLKENGLEARLQIGSTCPPVFDLVSTKNEGCAALNKGIQQRVESGEFDFVILAAYWSMYSEERNPGIRLQEGRAIIADGLPKTLRTIEEAGAQAWLIGQVPVYEQDIPTTRAILAMREVDLLSLQTRREHLRKSADFNEVAQNRLIIDPSETLCAPHCRFTDASGNGIYRDSNHLSVAGAMLWSTEFDRIIKQSIYSARRDSAPGEL